MDNWTCVRCLFVLTMPPPTVRSHTQWAHLDPLKYNSRWEPGFSGKLSKILSSWKTILSPSASDQQVDDKNQLSNCQISTLFLHQYIITCIYRIYSMPAKFLSHFEKASEGNGESFSPLEVVELLSQLLPPIGGSVASKIPIRQIQRPLLKSKTNINTNTDENTKKNGSTKTYTRKLVDRSSSRFWLVGSSGLRCCSYWDPASRTISS